jgi:hypothetical protein
VSKISAVSIFSGANQFQYLLEADARFCSLYGFTEQEVRDTYGPYIQHNAAAFQSSLGAWPGATPPPAPQSSSSALALPPSSTQSAVVAPPTGAALVDAVMGKLIEWYNGYKWNIRQQDKILNPWSVMSFMKTRELRGYWTSTALSSSAVTTLSANSKELVYGFPISSSELFASISANQFLLNWRQLAFQVRACLTNLFVFDCGAKNRPWLAPQRAPPSAIASALVFHFIGWYSHLTECFSNCFFTFLPHRPATRPSRALTNTAFCTWARRIARSGICSWRSVFRCSRVACTQRM